MEIREGNLILNVDKILDPEKNKFLETIAELLGRLVEEKEDMIWMVAADGFGRVALGLTLAKQMLGEKNEDI